MRLSAVLITYNEVDRIGKAIQSLGLADEIVVVDCGSEDGTQALARALGATVLHQKFLGYGAQRNWGLAQSQGDWILFLDADEWLSPELAADVARFLDEPGENVAADMLRRNHYLGRALRFAWPPEKKCRLIKRGHGRWDEPHVHEKLKPEGPTQVLAGHLEHDGYRNISAHWHRMHHYAQLSAQDMIAGGRHTHLGDLLLRPPAFFIKRYLLRLGILEGYRGFLIAFLGAIYTFQRFLCLRRLRAKG